MRENCRGLLLELGQSENDDEEVVSGAGVALETEGFCRAHYWHCTLD